MRHPILLDLFSCEGVGARGYTQAGWTVIGVDLEPRFARRYPGTFTAMDWAEALERYAPIATAIHASPPCQGYSIATAGNPTARAKHPRLIDPVREALHAVGKPYVIENVAQAAPHLHEPVTLCGTMFALTARDDDGTPLEMHRHRLFETNWGMTAPSACAHGAYAAQVAGSYGGARRDKHEARHVRHGGYVPAKHVQETLLGVPHDAHTLHGLWQSIPPAYTRHIGQQLMEAIA